VNILEALQDENLFAPWFRGNSWAAWKAFLCTLFGLQMSQAQLDLYREHTGREHRQQIRFGKLGLWWAEGAGNR
jgi:hypothetical protein